MTKKFEPKQLDKLPRLIILAQDRSSGKTLAAAIFATFAVMAGYKVIIFQNDRQSRLSMYGEVHRIEVASTEIILDNELADIDAHDPLLTAIGELANDPELVVIYDLAAGSIARVPDIIDALNINDRMVAMGETALTIVPVTARTDIAESGLRTVTEFQRVLSDHPTMPMVSYRDGSFADLPSDHPFHKTLSEARHGSLHFPKVNKQMAVLFEQLSIPLHEVGDPAGSLTPARLAADLGVSESRASFLIATCRHILTEMVEQAECLGFQFGA